VVERRDVEAALQARRELGAWIAIALINIAYAWRR